MKKLFTLFTLIVGVTVQAQLLSPSDVAGIHPNRTFTTPHHPYQLNHGSSVSRSSALPFSLDYVTSDQIAHSEANGYTVNLGVIQQINKNFPPDSLGSLRYCAVNFDSLLLNYDDGSGGGSANASVPVPKQGTVLTLDSLELLAIHWHDANAGADTLTITVYDTDSFKLTGQSATDSFYSTAVLWDTTLYLTQSLSPANATSYSSFTYYPNITLAPGKTFGVRVDFQGSLGSTFYLGSSYSSICGEQSQNNPGGNESAVPDNSVYYINYDLTSQGASYPNLTGINSIGYNSTVAPCIYYSLQNLYVFSYVTGIVDYQAQITPGKTIACPNEVVPLQVDVFGSDADITNIVWNTTSGNLDNSDQETNSITLDNSGNATVTVAVTTTDGTVYDTVTISVKAINAVFSSSPYTIQCAEGSSCATLSATVTGTTSGRTNSWSTGATTSSISACVPGSYILTVTNSVGCTASATAVVQYPNGINNNVNFSTPPGNLCVNQPWTFQNTSSSKEGWSAIWVTGSDTTNIDGVYDLNNYVPTTAGTKVIKLTMDSAGCIFSVSKTKSATVCTGIEDVSFNNSISMMPNPTSANVTVEVANVEKNVSVVFYNILGATVKSFSAEANGQFSQTFNVSDFATGTYIVRIASGNNVATKRLVVEGK